MSWGVYILRVLALALVYFLTGRLGLLLSTYTTHITLVWPPSGLAVAALWLWGPSLWPGIALGATCVNLAVGLPSSAMPWVLAGNTLAPLLTVFILKKTKFEPAFLRFGDFLRLFLATLLGMSVSATLGVLALYPLGVHLMTPWLTWWAGDFLGVLCFSPIFLTWNRGAWSQARERPYEFFAWVGTTLLMLSLVFVFNGDNLGPSFPIAFVPFPFLAWGTIRFGVVGNSFSLSALTVMAGFATALGRGPFGAVPIREGHFILWVFLVISTTMCWTINAFLTAEARAMGVQETMEEELQASEERLRLALSSAKQGLYDLNVVTGEAIVSDEYATMLGYDPKTFVESNQTWRARIHPDDVDRAWKAFEDYVAGNTSEYRSEFRLRTASGDWRWILSQGGLVSRTPEGKPLRMLGTHTDVNERRQLVASLEKSERRLETLVSHLPGMAYRCRGDGPRTLTYVSEGCLALTGYKRDELEEHRSVTYRELVHPEDVERVLKEFEQALSDRRASHYEYRIMKRDGQVRWVSDSFSGDYDDRGELTSVKGLIQDVTDSQQRRQERAKMERRMLEAQKLESLGILAGGIAHDFNNILTAILGNASQALEEISLDSPIRECLEAISECGERAAELSQQMLAYSGKGHFVIQKVDLSHLIQSTAQMMEAAVGKQANLNFQLDPELPMVKADISQLQQVVMNLVINAAEALGEKGGKVEVRTETVTLTEPQLSAYSQSSELQAGSYVCLSVRDNGQGLSSQAQEKIFDPFFTTKGTGRGLGLAAVQGIVRGHQGAIKVTSELGEGSTLELLFPTVSKVESSKPVRSPSPKWRGQGRVLLVDDEECVRTIIERVLVAMGFTVEVAENGEQAQTLFAADPHDFEFALLDMTMPGKNGEDTLKELRKLNPELKGIIMSGFSKDELTSPEEVIFLQKPMSMTTLRDVIKSLIED